jgi:2-polyprenyl-3-methyl-5-hydroxy-6-metoxy-1,4-benzoquinol methylase
MIKLKPKHGRITFDRKYYRRFFSRYDSDELEKYYRWFEGWIRFLERHISTLRNSEGKRALEIGCSIGAFAKILKERGFDVIATDVSPFIVQKAQRLQKDVKFLVVDVEKEIGVKSNVDYIFAFEVLEHLKDPKRALKNLRGKLNNNGVLIFSTPFPSKQSLADPTHINVHEPDWWLRMGKKVGFSKTKFVYATFIPYLYRFSEKLSIAFPIKLDLPKINSTCIFIFEK